MNTFIKIFQVFLFNLLIFYRSTSKSGGYNAHHQHQFYFSCSNGIVLSLLLVVIVFSLFTQSSDLWPCFLFICCLHLYLLHLHRTLHLISTLGKLGEIHGFLSNHDQALRLCTLAQKFQKKFGYVTFLFYRKWHCIFRANKYSYFHLLKHLQVPDTFFANEKSAQFHIATTPNTFIRIKASGEVFLSMRLVCKA